MTHKRPRRRTCRHFKQIFLTDALTFMRNADRSEPSRDPSTSAVGVNLQSDFVAHQNLDPMKTHLPGKVCKRQLARRKLDPKQSIRKGFFYDSLHDFRFHHICAP